MIQKIDITAIISDSGNQDLEKWLADYLTVKQEHIAFAESCTGGYLSHLITALPGSSVYFKGSIVAYANDIKTNILHVPEDVLLQEGAVSKATVSYMANNTKELFQTEHVLTVSGIAGPDGGSPEKPIGTVWIAMASHDVLHAKCFHFGNIKRNQIIRLSALHALYMFYKFIESNHCL